MSAAGRRPPTSGAAARSETAAAEATADAAQSRPTPSPELLEAARAVFENAYVPYSGFHVGAALRADDGTIYRGCNVENASYGLSRCAEQSAVQAMVSAGARHFGELVVYASAQHPASPCGACRQILFEFAPDAVVHLVNHLGTVTTTSVAELLPDGFGLEPRS